MKLLWILSRTDDLILFIVIVIIYGRIKKFQEDFPAQIKTKITAISKNSRAA